MMDTVRWRHFPNLLAAVDLLAGAVDPSMARRSISRRDMGGELLQQGGDIVEHRYLRGIRTRASLLA
jgi:hypothetical protein